MYKVVIIFLRIALMRVMKRVKLIHFIMLTTQITCEKHLYIVFM